MAIEEFVNALTATRERMTFLNGEVTRLEGERRRIEAAPPHTDDIVATLEAGLGEARTEFLRWTAERLDYQRAISQQVSGTAIQARSPLILSDDGSVPGHRSFLGFGGSNGPLNVAAVAHFLAPLIAPMLRDLVDEVCPAAAQGMKRADQVDALAAIEAELTALRTERDALAGELERVRAATAPADPVDEEQRALDRAELAVSAAYAEQQRAAADLAEARTRTNDRDVLYPLEVAAERAKTATEIAADRRDSVRREIEMTRSWNAR